MSKQRREMSLRELVESLPRAANDPVTTHRAKREFEALVSALEEAQELIHATWCDDADEECPHCEECDEIRAVLQAAKE